MKYNFDVLADRRNTDSYKWDVKEGELPMWVADMDFMVFPGIVDALQRRVNIKAYGYSKIPEAYFENMIWWWKEFHHTDVKREWMIYCSGVVPAISSVVRRVTKPGDNVIVQSPVYNIFYNSIINNQRKVLENKLIYKGDSYSIDFADLEEKMSQKRTSLMILCNPHNPIGHIWSKEELYKISKLAKKYEVYVLSDEIHCDITNPNEEYNSFLDAARENRDISITCISASKVFNVAGLQAAAVIIPDGNLRAFVDRGLNNDEIAEPNFFSMDANIAAFTPEGREWVNQLNEYIFENKKYFVEYLEKNCPKLRSIKGNATYLMWIDVSNYGIKSGLFAQRLRELTGLYISSGEIYGGDGEKFVRINLATSHENVKDACNRLEKFVKILDEEK